jgi:hypothetical protein
LMLLSGSCKRLRKSGSASLRSGKAASDVSDATIGRNEGGTTMMIVTMGLPPTRYTGETGTVDGYQGLTSYEQQCIRSHCIFLCKHIRVGSAV